MSKSDSKVLLGCNKLDLQVVLSHISASFPVLPFFFPGIRNDEHLETTIRRDGIQTPRKPTWHSLLFEWRNTSPHPAAPEPFPRHSGHATRLLLPARARAGLLPSAAAAASSSSSLWYTRASNTCSSGSPGCSYPPEPAAGLRFVPLTEPTPRSGRSGQNCAQQRSRCTNTGSCLHKQHTHRRGPVALRAELLPKQPLPPPQRSLFNQRSRGEHPHRAPPRKRHPRCPLLRMPQVPELVTQSVRVSLLLTHKRNKTQSRQNKWLDFAKSD